MTAQRERHPMTSLGVDILPLPMPDREFLPDGHADLNAPDAAGSRPPADEDMLARFRWWIGHQLTFCVWRLLREACASAALAERPPAEAIATAANLFDLYSVMLLYTGSCPPEVYRRTLRPAMASAHPSFSGRWARDYEDIPQLLQATRRAHPPRVVDRLLAASRANHIVHMSVARRLVPDGASLLRQAGRDQTQQVTDDERDTFDSFFLVVRREISRPMFTARLGVLATLVAADLTERPLDEATRGWELPRAHAQLVTRLQCDAVAILRDAPVPALRKQHAHDSPQEHLDE